jgi:hypothetical protein
MKHHGRYISREEYRRLMQSHHNADLRDGIPESHATPVPPVDDTRDKQEIIWDCPEETE